MAETQEKKSTRSVKKSKVTLLKNIKFNGKRYKNGQQIEVDEETAKEFAALGVIAGEGDGR